MELTGYLAVARRWWWTLLVATWIAGVAGFVAASQIPATYEAQTQLLVGPYNTDRETLAAAGDLVQTYSTLVTTTPLLESAIRETGVPLTAEELGLATRVTANDTTRFLTIRVQDFDPQRAADLANQLGTEISLLASRGTNRPEGQLQTVQLAVASLEAVAPQKSLIVALAALAALLAAMVLVMLVEYLSAAVRTDDELHRLSGLPLLGRVSTNRALPINRLALANRTPDSAVAAAYRLVLAKAAFRDRERRVHSIIVVGTGPDSANAQVAANLAEMTAKSGRQVILVDADMSDAYVSRIYGLVERPGLSDIVRNDSRDVDTGLTRVSSELRVVPSGTAPDHDSIDVAGATRILAALAAVADTVIVSTGALHLSAASLVWAQAGDAAILVAALDLARRDDVTYAADSLRLVGTNLVGSVLATPRGTARYGAAAPSMTERLRLRGGEEAPHAHRVPLVDRAVRVAAPVATAPPPASDRPTTVASTVPTAPAPVVDRAVQVAAPVATAPPPVADRPFKVAGTAATVTAPAPAVDRSRRVVEVRSILQSTAVGPVPLVAPVTDPKRPTPAPGKIDGVSPSPPSRRDSAKRTIPAVAGAPATAAAQAAAAAVAAAPTGVADRPDLVAATAATAATPAPVADRARRAVQARSTARPTARGGDPVVAPVTAPKAQTRVPRKIDGASSIARAGAEPRTRSSRGTRTSPRTDDATRIVSTSSPRTQRRRDPSDASTS